MSGLFSPQSMAVTSLSNRKKKRSPYIDVIRGQYGQATQDVIAGKADVLQRKFQSDQLGMQRQNYSLQAQQMQQQKDIAKKQGMVNMIGTGIQAGSLALNAYDSGLFSDLGSKAKKVGGGIMTGVKWAGSQLGIPGL